jgi:hypothetical protein
MKDKPDLFSGEGLLVDIPVDGFALGAALNTNTKVTNYATKRLEAIEAYAVFRLNRIKQFRVEKATILGE